MQLQRLILETVLAVLEFFRNIVGTTFIADPDKCFQE